MDRGWILIGLIGLAIVSVGISITPIESAIPPTRAFASVLTDAGTIIANSYNSQLIAPIPPYAQISDGTTQACISGSAKNVTLNTNDSIHKITHSISSSTNEIKIQENGIYQIIAVPQVGEAGPGQATGIHDFWMMKNNAQVTNSNVKTTILLQIGGTETFLETLNWVGRLNQNDVISFQQGCTDSDIGIIFTAAGVPPATPSIIISIVKLNW